MVYEPLEIAGMGGGHKNRDADQHHFNVDPDPAFHFNADPDPAFHLNADPVPARLQSEGNPRISVKTKFLLT